MHSANRSDSDIQEIGGEPLEGSGFETENLATGFESYEKSAQGELNQ